jgi:hypothetical protein
VLKKLTATGIVAAAAAGFMLLGGTANADRLSVNQAEHAPTAYYPHHHDGWGRWHHRYHHRNSWGQWRHRDRWNHHRFHFHH